MKRFIFISIMAAICGMTAMAQNRPDVVQQTTGGNHDDIPTFSVARPVLNYDADVQEITVIGMLEYYDVEMTLASNNAVVYSATVEGDMGVINVESLTHDVYNITLTGGGRQYRYIFNASTGTVTFRGFGGTGSITPQSVIDKNKNKR